MAIPTVVKDIAAAGAASQTELLPEGWEAGDIVFVFVACLTTQALPTTTGASPKNIAASDSGWTQMEGSPQTVTGGSRLYGFWRRMVVGDVSPQTGDSGEYNAFFSAVVRGAIATGTPFEALAFGSETTSDISLSIPSITTLGADRLIFGACTTGADKTSDQFSEWANANLASPAAEEVEDVCTNAGGGGGIAGYAGGKAVAGETGATTATLAEASPKAFVHLAVIPAASATKVTLTPATETDGGQVLSVTKPIHKTLAVAAESDAAQALVATKPIHAALASAAESDAAQELGFHTIQTRLLEAATESDAAIDLDLDKHVTLGVGSESDMAQALLASKPILKLLTTALESDVAEALTAARYLLINPALESDTAQVLAVPQRQSISPALESDIAQALTLPIRVTLDAATESDAATALSATHRLTLADATESDLASALSAAKLFDLAAASESDSAQAFSVSHRVVLAPASELDSAVSLASTKAASLSAVEETDIAAALSFSSTYSLAPASEADSAHALSATKLATIAAAVETDLAVSLGLTHLHYRDLITAAEIDEALALGARGGPINLSPAGESDTAQALTFDKPVHVALEAATENDLATIFALARAFELGIATETDLAVALSLAEPEAHFLTLIPAMESDVAVLLAFHRARPREPIWGPLIARSTEGRAVRAGDGTGSEGYDGGMVTGKRGNAR